MTDWQNIAVIGIGILVLGFSVRWIVVPKNSAVIFLPITALFYSPKKIKIASILASKYLSMYPLSDGRLFTPCDLVYNLASFLNPL